MKINSFNSLNQTLNFGDALSTKQEKKYLQLMNQIKEVQGHQDGIRVAKIYTPAIPSDEKNDTGIGKPSSREAFRMYELARIYGNATAIKFMPLGQLTDKQPYNEKHYPGAYQRSAFSFGEDMINLESLTSKEYGSILPNGEYKAFINEHNKNDNNQSRVDFETTLGWKNQEDYPINKPLRIAFENFKNTDNQSHELNELRKEFDEFKNKKEPVDYDDIYTRLALFPYLKDWSNARTDFFRGFDSNPEIRAKKMPEYNRLKDKYHDEIEFYKFKQFIAHKQIQKTKQYVNSLGMDLMSDCAVAFSWVEEQVFPDAFLRDGQREAQIGWGINALNYYDLINKEDSPAHRLLKAKVAHNLVNFDGIRFDVGWGYMNPIFHYGDYNYHKLDAGVKIVDFIEKVATEIKGEDFDHRKLMYECDANGTDFNLWNSKYKIDKAKGLAILSTEDEKNDSANIGWGSLPFYKYNIGLGDDDFILGTNNHDKEGVMRCASDSHKSSQQVGALQRTFNKRSANNCPDGWKFFKDDENEYEHYRKYVRGRFAEVDLAKHSFIMMNDLLGRTDKIDYHSGGEKNDKDKDYQMRLERNYEENYHRALQGEVGYNAADVKSFRMELDGSNNQYRDLYEKALKYSAYLKHKGGIYTREQADNSNRRDLDIESMSIDEINRL